MVKVSISLPNNALITFESDEAEVLREVVGMALRDLPRDLMQVTAVVGSQSAEVPAEKSTNEAVSPVATTAAAVTQEPRPVPEPVPTVDPAVPANTVEEPAGVDPPVQQPAAAPPAPAPTPPAVSEQVTPLPSPNVGDVSESEGMPAEFLSESGRESFTAFCHGANPLGDMRRVVVAAEGASRHFQVDGVNSDDLGWLFDIAGWRRPGDFTQTLRNAARSKFGWLERIPGRSGRYAATPLGLSKTGTAGLP